MKELFLLKLGEIVLKGQNRRVFEDKLKTVTRRRMTKFGDVQGLHRPVDALCGAADRRL